MIGQNREKILTPKDTHLHRVEFAGMGYEAFDVNMRKYIKHIEKTHTTETVSFGADIESDYNDTIESSARQILELIEKDVSDGIMSQLALQGHSMGGRTLMHVLLRYPEILDSTREITLIHIPPHLDIFPGSQIQKIFSRKGLHFSDTFLCSLEVDTADINNRFFALLRKKGWKGNISAVSDIQDATLTKLYGASYPIQARELSEQLREFRDISTIIHTISSKAHKMLSRVNPINILYNKPLTVGHNGENIEPIVSQEKERKINDYLMIITLLAILNTPASHSSRPGDYEKSINEIPIGDTTWSQLL